MTHSLNKKPRNIPRISPNPLSLQMWLWVVKGLQHKGISPISLIISFLRTRPVSSSFSNFAQQVFHKYSWLADCSYQHKSPFSLLPRNQAHPLALQGPLSPSVLPTENTMSPTADPSTGWMECSEALNQPHHFLQGRESVGPHCSYTPYLFKDFPLSPSRLHFIVHNPQSTTPTLLSTSLATLQLPRGTWP